MNLSIIVSTTGRGTLESVLEGLLRSEKFYEIAPEVIVVFSTGKTRCGTLCHRFPGMNFFRLSTPGKKVQARNLGIEKSTGDVLAFLADDTIPSPRWLRSVMDFHEERPEDTAAMLGDVRWHPALPPSKFREWMGERCEFEYAKIRKHRGKEIHWRHVYPCNFSVKRALLQNQKFCEEFFGWRYEGAELGYRLHQLGMQLFFYPRARVWHRHAYTFEKSLPLLHRVTAEAHLFEKIHPNIHVVPRGFHAAAIRGLMPVARLFSSVIPEAGWWAEKHRGWVENLAHPGTIAADENINHHSDDRPADVASSAGSDQFAAQN